MLTRNRPSVVQLLLLAACALAMSCLPGGCGGGETDHRVADDRTAGPPPDPRFPSADALLEHFNSLNTASPATWTEIADLYYPENDLQRRLVQIRRDTAAAVDLHHAEIEYFGQEAIDGFFRKYEREMGIESPSTSRAKSPPRPNEPAETTEQSGEYVLAEYTDGRGDPHTLYLVQRDNRWWISGYGLEYENTLSPEALDRREQTAREIGRDARRNLARLRAGDFASYEEYFIQTRMPQPPR